MQWNKDTLVDSKKKKDDKYEVQSCWHFNQSCTGTCGQLFYSFVLTISFSTSESLSTSTSTLCILNECDLRLKGFFNDMQCHILGIVFTELKNKQTQQKKKGKSTKGEKKYNKLYQLLK